MPTMIFFVMLQLYTNFLDKEASVLYEKKVSFLTYSKILPLHFDILYAKRAEFEGWEVYLQINTLEPVHYF